MIREHFRLATRNLWRNPLFSCLNIVGLAVGLAAGVFVLLWNGFDLGFDRFHRNLSSIHVLMQNQTQGGETYTFQALPGPLAAAMRAELPEVEWASRSTWPQDQLVRLGEKVVQKGGFYAEPDFFNIFQFEKLAGDPVAALREPNTAVVTDKFAADVFGSEDPVGKAFRLNNRFDIRVGAVVRRPPLNSSVRFAMVLPFKMIEAQNADWINTNWNNNSFQTWAAVRPGADLAVLNRKLENFIQSHSEGAAAHAFAYPLSRLHLHNKFAEGRPSGGRITRVWLLGLVGAFILFIACANYMNLSTARSTARAREVGIRKAIGSGRGQLVGQFLAEAVLVTGIALGLALLLVKALLPAFNRLTAMELSLNRQNWPVLVAVALLAALTGLLAGSWPAYFMSKFQPARTLRGQILSDQGGGGLLRKGLVTFQFFTSIFLIVSTLVIHKQHQHLLDRPMGFDAQSLVSLGAGRDMNRDFGAFKSEILQLPGVKSVSTGDHNLVQIGSNTTGIGWPGKTDDQDFLIGVTSVGLDYTRTTGMTVVAGRDFSPEFGADSMACLLNETAVRMMGLRDPVGTVITWDTTHPVIGVVKDFVYNDAAQATEPLAIFHDPKGGLGNIFRKIEDTPGWRGRLADIEKVAKRMWPGQPFEPHFVREDYEANFAEIKSSGLVANIFGGLAVFVSCLGLFGLAAFFAEKRAKEIGIRKVLGASVAGLWMFFSKDFLKPVLLAFALAAAPAFWAMNKVLSAFDYRVAISWDVFALAGVAAVVVAAATVGFHSLRAATADPVKSLRTE